MKRKFTKLIAALALLLFVAPPMVGWGQQEVTLWSEDFSSYSANDVPTGGTYSYVCTDGTGNSAGATKIYNENTGGGAAPELLVGKKGSGAGATGGTFTAVIPLDNIEGTVTLTYYQNKQKLSVSSTTPGVSGGQEIKPSEVGQQTTTFTGITTSMTSLTIVFQATTTSNVRLDNIVLKGTTAGGGSQLTPNDLALTNAPVALTFDLYNNNAAQTISYTTSGTGNVSVSSSNYVTTQVDQVNKTITVTPNAVTPSAQTITVSQAADGTYDAGQVTFTVEVDDSTPGADVTFTAGTDEGTTTGNNSPDEMTKGGVTVSSTDAAFATTEYRLYSGSTTTISAPGYIISSIVFTGCDNSRPVSALSVNDNNGTYSVANNVGTWTGSSSTVSFDASAQARASKIEIWMTAQQAQQYDLTVSALTNVEMYVFDYDDQTEALIEGGATAQAAQVFDGTQVLVSVSAATGYALVSFTVDGVDHLGDINSSNEYVFTMPSHNVTITATAALAYDITYSSNGMEDQVQVTSTTLELPAGEDLDSEFSFAGWTTNPNNVVNILPAGTQVTIQGGETFYAVYAHTEEQEAYFQKVTEAPQDWSGDYLIVAVGTYANDDEYSVAFDGSLVDQGLDAVQNTIDVEFDSNGHIALDEFNGSAYFTIAPIVENSEIAGWSIQSASGYYVGRTTNSNGMNISETTEYSHTLSIDENENAVITSSSAPALRYNKASDQKRFRYYKDNGQQPIQLYKKTVVSQGTVAYYTRVFIWEIAEANMTITGPSIIPSGSTLNMGTYTLSYATGVNNLIIEDGGQLISHMGVQATMLKNITGTDFGSQANPTNAGYYLIASPLAVAPTAVNNMIVTANGDYDLYAFDPTAEMEWQNYKSSSNFTLALGKGYLYANSNTTTLEFAGQLNSGFVPTNLNYVAGDDLKSLNLVGNPFAHEYDFVVKQNSDAVPFNYLTLNATGDGFITNNTGDNAAVTLDPMEAILVQAPGADYHFADPNAGDMPGIIDDGELEGLLNISVSRNRGASVGSTAIIDNALVSFGNAPLMKKIRLSDYATELCMLQGGEEMAVVRAQGQGELPVSFKAAENGSYTLSVEVNNVEMDYLHLIDNMTGADVDLLATPSYTFEAKTIDYASRFRLVFSANSISEDADGDNAFAYFNGSSWTISNMGEATLQVVDVMGRVLSSETLSGNAEVSINQPAGVYMLRLVSGDSVKVQKVVVR